MLDTTNAELTLTLEPSGLASTKIRGTISLYCDLVTEQTFTSLAQVPDTAKEQVKQCIQDVIYGDLIQMLIGLYQSTLNLVPYGTPLYKHIERQFDAAFDQMRLHKVPFTDPRDPHDEANY